MYLYSYVVSVTNIFLGREMLHCWFGSEFGFPLWSSMPREWNLWAWCLTGNMLFWISWHFQYRWFPFTIISPFIVSWHFGKSLFFGKICFSCKNSICWTIVVSITTNRLMLISNSILNFLDLLTDWLTEWIIV